MTAIEKLQQLRGILEALDALDELDELDTNYQQLIHQEEQEAKQRRIGQLSSLLRPESWWNVHGN